MFLDLLLFPLFLLLLYVMGAGVLRARSGDYPAFMYVMTALLALGLLSVLFNFFTGVNSPIYYTLLGLLVLWGATQIRQTDFPRLGVLLLIGAALSPITANMDCGSDAGLYHLPHQQWIRSEKIVLGLANFQTRFGFGSLLEYIEAPLWWKDQFKLVAYASTAFLVMFFLFLYDMARAANARLNVIAFLAVLGLLFYSGYIDFHYTSTDMPTGILFALSFFYGLWLLLDGKQVGFQELTILGLSAVFCFTLKVSGALIFLWVAIVSFMLWRAQRVEKKALLLAAILPMLIVIIWTVRSVMTSGCLLYPLTWTCLDVPWTALSSAKENAAEITAWARHPRTGLYSLNSMAWFGAWWWPNNQEFCIAIGLVIMAMSALYLFVFKREKEEFSFPQLAALIFTALSLSFWFWKAPTPRFGVGVFIILPVIFAIGLFGFRTLKEKPASAVAKLPLKFDTHQALALLFLALLAVKFGGIAAGRLLIHNNMGFQMLTVPAAQVVSNDVYGVMPQDLQKNDNCWLAKRCANAGRPHSAPKEKYGYKYFHD